MAIETGLLLGRIPYVATGDGCESLLVVNGGQGFVRRSDPAKAARDAGRIARMLPPGTSFVLMNYDPTPAADLDAAAITRDVAQALAERWQAPVPIVGLSYGGLIAGRVAAAHPHLVSRLALIASAHRFSATGQARVRRQIDLLESDDLPGFTREFAALFRQPLLNQLVRLRLWMGRRRLRESLAPATTVARYLRAIVDAPPLACDRISVPTLIIGGDRDQFFGDGAMNETAACITGARLELLSRETHMAPVERPRSIASALGNFVGADPSPQPSLRSSRRPSATKA